MSLSLDPTDYTKSIKSELRQIASAAQDSMLCSRVVVLKTANISNIVTWCAFHFFQIIFDFFSCLFPNYYKKQNEDTISYFEQVFGSKRVEEISSRYNLHLDRKKIQGVPMTKADLQTLFAGISAVTDSDMRELFSNIQQILHTIKDHWQAQEFYNMVDSLKLDRPVRSPITAKELSDFFSAIKGMEGKISDDMDIEQIQEFCEHFRIIGYVGITLTANQICQFYHACKKLNVVVKSDDLGSVGKDKISASDIIVFSNMFKNLVLKNVKAKDQLEKFCLAVEELDFIKDPPKTLSAAQIADFCKALELLGFKDVSLTEQQILDFCSVFATLDLVKENTKLSEIAELSDERRAEFCKLFEQIGFKEIDLSEDQIRKFCTAFEGLEYDDLTKEHFDFLYELCNPLDFETTCLNQPHTKATGYDRGLTADGLIALGAQIRDVKEQILQEDETDRLHHSINVRIMKRIVGYFNPVGLVIRTEEGWFKAKEKFYSAGMYAVLLESIDSPKQPDRLYFLPTQTLGFVPWKWEPAVEDLRKEIGSWGVMFARKLFDYIKKQANADPGYRIDILGYSLGGAQAQRFFAFLIAAQIHYVAKSITTFASPGIDKETRDWMDKKLDPADWPEVVHYRDDGDVVALVGETVIPAKKIVFISNKEGAVDPLKRTRGYYDVFHGVFLGVRSMNKEHCQLIEEKSTVIEITDPDQIAKLSDNTHLGWEELRSTIADLFSAQVFVRWLERVEEASIS